uniref:hypothetical protein n=1 Tax=Arthrobacter silvisoli TaxID=2291022 RepID=UPI003F498935
MSIRGELFQHIWNKKASLDRPVYIDANAATKLAEELITAGYRKIFDGDCGLSGVKVPDERDAAEAWMRWANLATNDEIGAIGAMKQMLTELGYRKASS